jgi:predicted DNA-binding ribbon-helix-helix protein
MPTKNPRVNVTFEKTISDLLVQIAEQKNISVSKLVHMLIFEALDHIEDMYFSKLAES